MSVPLGHYSVLGFHSCICSSGSSHDPHVHLLWTDQTELWRWCSSL